MLLPNGFFEYATLNRACAASRPNGLGVATPSSWSRLKSHTVVDVIGSSETGEEAAEPRPPSPPLLVTFHHHLDPRENEERAEDVDDPAELIDERRAGEDHDRPHDERPEDDPEQNLVLILHGHREAGEEQREDKHVVHAGGSLTAEAKVVELAMQPPGVRRALEVVAVVGLGVVEGDGVHVGKNVYSGIEWSPNGPLSRSGSRGST